MQASMELTELTNEAVRELFGERETDFDLFEGTVRLATRERQVFITSETIYGLWKALSQETGDAWKIVMKNCGYLWGKRVMQRLDRDVAARHQCTVGELRLESFVELVEVYFSYHGWGRLKLDLSHTEDAGIIAATLDDSLVGQSLREAGGTADYLIAGMLRAIFEHVAGRALDCLQVTSTRQGDSYRTTFLLSAPQRIESIEMLAGQSSLDDAVRELRAA